MLTEILKRLLSLQVNEDKELKGGLTLCWRPPNILILTRKGEPPSPQELKTVEKYLKELGWNSFAGKLGQKRNSRQETWYYWRLSLNRSRPLL